MLSIWRRPIIILFGGPLPVGCVPLAASASTASGRSGRAQERGQQKEAPPGPCKCAPLRRRPPWPARSGRRQRPKMCVANCKSTATAAGFGAETAENQLAGSDRPHRPGARARRPGRWTSLRLIDALEFKLHR